MSDIYAADPDAFFAAWQAARLVRVDLKPMGAAGLTQAALVWRHWLVFCTVHNVAWDAAQSADIARFWFGLMAPAGTPPAVVTRVNAEVGKILADKDVADRILAIGPIVETGVAPEQFAAFLREENQRWGMVAKEIGLLPE